jgi:hypothetical protein
MPLTATDVVPGAVAYFDVNALNADPAVTVTGDPVQRQVTGNQFVCYKVDGATSFWSPLTGTYKLARLPIKPAWLTHAYGALAAGQVWLQDGKNTYRGPHSSFIAATHSEHPFAVARPYISHTGLTEIHAAIRQRGGAI